MSTSAQRGHIAFALQSGRIGSGAFTPGSYTWQRHRAVAVDFAVQDLIDALPLEVGGGLFVNSTYKNGVFLAGSFGLEARLESSLGHLLYAAAGATAATAASAGVTSRVSRFRVNPTDDTALPWLTMRKYTPDVTGTGGQTEYGVDCRVSSLVLTVPQMGTLKAEVGVVGRRPIAVDNESATGSAYEDGSSLALSCQGSVTLSNFTGVLPAGGAFAGAQIMIGNQFSDPRQEMVIGSYYPDDLIPLSRSAMVRLVYKWNDPQLYRQLVYGAPSGGQREWTPIIQTSPVQIRAASAGVVPTYTNPYRLDFYAPNVDWRMSPVQLAPGQLLMVELIGTVVQAAAGTPTWHIDLWNNTTYTFP